MYNHHDAINNPTFSIKTSKHIPDMDHAQIGNEQDNKDEPCSDLKDKSESSSTITVVPFNKTQTGSFQ